MSKRVMAGAVSFVVGFLFLAGCAGTSTNLKKETAQEAPKGTNEIIKKVDNEKVEIKPIAQPVIAQPVIAQPVIAQPVIAQPVIAQPVIAQKCTITGTITNIDKKPIPGALVKLIKDDKEILLLNTSADGTYKMSDIIPGNYVMGFWIKGYKGIRKPVVVEKADKPLEINMSLEKIVKKEKK